MGKTKSELEALAARHGWKPRPLTAAELSSMSANEYEYHSGLNAQELERALAEPGVRMQNIRNAKAADFTRMFSGRSTPEELAGVKEAAERLAATYPQLIGSSLENGQAFVEWFKANNVVPVSYEAFVRAFEELATEGRLLLSLPAVGRAGIRPGRDREILTALMRGQKVRNNPVRERELAKEAVAMAIRELPDEISNLNDLTPEQTRAILSPAPSRTPEATQSAAEYRKEHAADFERPATVLEIKSIEKILLTVLAHHPEIVLDEALKEKIAQRYKGPMSVQGMGAFLDALRDAGELTIEPDKKISGELVQFTDMGGSKPGFPDYAGMDKYSFRALVEGMSAAQLAERCRQDAKFKAALDALD